MKTVNEFAFQFATFSLQNITSLDAGVDGKIKTAVNIRFNQSVKSVCVIHEIIKIDLH